MSAVATEPQDRFVHGAGFYSSEEQFQRMFVPFCEEGLDRGEATVVRVASDKADLLRAALGEAERLTFLPHDEQYESPPEALVGALSAARSYSSANGARMRLLGELPTLTGLARDAWMRYEATANHVLRDFPIFGVCPFDSRTLSTDTRAELLRIHHVVLDGDGRPRRSPRFEPPEVFFANGRHEVRDPLESGPALLELTDPSPAAARSAVARLSDGMQLDSSSTDAVLLAVSELVTNALLHGLPPLTVRGWGRQGRVLVAVRDGGEGPADPYVGLRPRAHMREGGRGLWITHQLLSEVALARTPEGFVVRVAAGTPDSP